VIIDDNINISDFSSFAAIVPSLLSSELSFVFAAASISTPS
jgi:hypothetical protein